MPADAYPLAPRPTPDAGADRVDHSGHFMTWNPRILNTRVSPFLDKRIAVANATSLHLHPHRSRARVRHRPFNDLKGPVRARDLHNAHGGHGFLQFVYADKLSPGGGLPAHSMPAGRCVNSKGIIVAANRRTDTYGRMVARGPLFA